MDHPPCDHTHVFCNRPQRQGWQETQATDDEDDKYQPDDKEGPVIPQGTLPRGHDLLDDKRPGKGEGEDDHQIPPDKHGKCGRQVIEEAVRIEPGKGAAVIGDRRRIGIKKLGQTMGSCVVQPDDTPGADSRSSRRTPRSVEQSFLFTSKKPS